MLTQITSIIHLKFWNLYHSQKWFEVVCKLALFVFLSFLVYYSVARVIGRTLYFAFPINREVYAVSFALVSILYSTHWISLYERKKFSLGLSVSISRTFLIIFGMIVGMFMCSFNVLCRMLMMKVSFEWNVDWNWSNCLQGFIVTFSAAAVEEFFHRGFMFVILRYWLGIVPALLVSSILFALAHFSNESLPHSDYFISMIYYLIPGIFLGIAFLTSKTIWFPVALHTGWNWFAFSVVNAADEKAVEWIEPAVYIYYENTGQTYLMGMRWIPILILEISACYILIRRNKALYQTLSRYFSLK